MFAVRFSRIWPVPALEDERKNYLKKANDHLNAILWHPIRDKARTHQASSRYSDALREVNRFDRVYAWFSKDPDVMTEAGREHRELLKTSSKELNEAFSRDMATARQKFGIVANRAEAYGLLSTMAVMFSARKIDIEQARDQFFAKEVKERLGTGVPGPKEYGAARVGSQVGAKSTRFTEITATSSSARTARTPGRLSASAAITIR